MARFNIFTQVRRSVKNCSGGACGVCGHGAGAACELSEIKGVRGAAAAGRDALNRFGLAEFCSVAALDGGVAPKQGRTTSCARDFPASLNPSNALQTPL
ncbi:unnamed protein product [Euphydryas editha]|uniref:Uncharacterized protein n=1 Tax=Euphydryas editha TaxID=104508 RepID=A0AAU9UTR3_EUPED|nr:unnamed protein product [Euphydryas editha]